MEVHSNGGLTFGLTEPCKPALFTHKKESYFYVTLFFSGDPPGILLRELPR